MVVLQFVQQSISTNALVSLQSVDTILISTSARTAMSKRHNYVTIRILSMGTDVTKIAWLSQTLDAADSLQSVKWIQQKVV